MKNSTLLTTIFILCTIPCHRAAFLGCLGNVSACFDCLNKAKSLIPEQKGQTPIVLHVHNNIGEQTPIGPFVDMNYLNQYRQEYQMQHPFYNEMIPQRNNSLIRDIEMATIYSAGNYNQPVIVHSTKTTTTTTTEIIESISPMFSPTPTPRPRLSHNFTHSPVIPQIMDIPPNIGRASFPTSRQSLPQNSSRN